MEKDPNENPAVTDDAESQSSLAQLTAEIVSAYVSNNGIASSELGGLISAAAGQLGKIGAEPEQPTEEKPAPAVSVRRSLRPDHLVCLVCGKPKKTLKRHLAVRHDLSPAEYRERFGLKPDYPMTAPNYTRQRREVALATGLGRLKEPASQRRKGRRVKTRRAAGRRCWRVIAEFWKTRGQPGWLSGGRRHYQGVPDA